MVHWVVEERILSHYIEEYVISNLYVMNNRQVSIFYGQRYTIM